MRRREIAPATLVNLRDAHANDIDCGCYGPGRCRYADMLEELRSKGRPWWRRILARLRRLSEKGAKR